MLDSLDVTDKTIDPPLRTIPVGGPWADCHQCGRRHRSWGKVADCVWPRAIWILGGEQLRVWAPGGNGVPVRASCYALIARCSPGSTITLWPKLSQALRSKRKVDHTACGHLCMGPAGHEIVKLDPRPLDWDRED